MEWYQAILKISPKEEEAVSFIFNEMGSSGIAIENPKDVADVLSDRSTWDYVDPSLLKADRDAPIKMTAYFETDDPILLEKELRREIGKIDCGFMLEIEKMPDIDWSKEWKKFYKPIDTKVITVVPKWMESDSDLPKIYIEPGKAFGTGEHESTRMCLDLLCGVRLKGKSVIDVGCGSGILGISAAILGAEKTLCLDIDEEAVALAKENAALNGAAGVTILQGDLLSVCAEKADVIFANLTANLLKRLLPQGKNFLNENGVMIVSGIIRERVEEMNAYFAEQGFLVDLENDMGEWHAARMKKDPLWK